MGYTFKTNVVFRCSLFVAALMCGCLGCTPDSPAPPPPPAGGVILKAGKQLTIPEGESYRLTLLNKGKVHYDLTVHQDGTFNADKLPPGNYEVIATPVTKDGKSGKALHLSQELVVEPGKTSGYTINLSAASN